MRDIIYRPVTAHTSSVDHSDSPKTKELPAFKEPSSLAGFLHTLNILGGSFASFFEGKGSNPSDTYQPTFQQKITRLPLTKTAGHRIRKGGRIVFEKTRETAGTTKKHLKTPLGKVAAINMAALLALFVYVQAQPHANLSEATRNAGNAVAASSLQHYLPVIGDSVSKAFDETAITQEAKHLPLNVWVTPWNIGQVTSNISAYSSFSAFWATVGSDGSTITPKSDFSSWQTFQTADASTAPTWLTIDGNPNYTYLTLTSPTTQQAFISASIALLKQYKFTGLDIDFEGLGSDNRDAFTAFTRNLATALHTENKQLAVTLEARIANQVPMDWHSVGQIADEVRIMTYDYHSQTTSQPGPIAPLGWVKEVVDYAVQNIDPSKIVVGLGNYGYDWQAPDATNASWTGTGVSFEEAQTLSQSQNSPIIHATGIDPRGYDIGIAPYFQYTDTTGNQHSVWFEDAASLQQKVDLLNQYPLKGVIFWSVGIGDQTFWTQQ